jgi:hypothetical protein
MAEEAIPTKGSAMSLCYLERLYRFVITFTLVTKSLSLKLSKQDFVISSLFQSIQFLL